VVVLRYGKVGLLIWQGGTLRQNPINPGIKAKELFPPNIMGAALLDVACASCWLYIDVPEFVNE
jgi:hypothetical protein